MGDLIKLGCLVRTDDNILKPTPLGIKVVNGAMDVATTVLVEVGYALGIPDHARVAAAYLAAEASNAELFTTNLPQLRGPGPLSPSQIAFGVENSDVLTAVDLFCKWRLDGFSLWHHNVKEVCFRKMWHLLESDGHRGYPLDLEGLRKTPDWQRGLKMCLAFALQSNIVHYSGGWGVSSRVEADAHRGTFDPPLELLNMRVQVSSRSLCCGDYLQAGQGRWLVYAGAARGRTVKAVTELDQEVAAWFGTLAASERTPLVTAAARFLTNFVAQGRGAQAPDYIVRLVRRSVSSLVLINAVDAFGIGIVSGWPLSWFLTVAGRILDSFWIVTG